jgi:hypothetical protein
MEAEERQNRAEREMQANILRRKKQGAIRQGQAKIRAEAEKEKLHRGEKEARKQQDLEI